MKNILLYLLCAAQVFLIQAASAQRMSASTNEIRLKLSEPTPDVSHLPVIEWVVPRIEHTTSTDKIVHLEADVRSVMPVKRVKIVLSNATTKEVISAKNIKHNTDDRNFHIAEKLHLMDGALCLDLVLTLEGGTEVSSARYITIGQDLIANAVMSNRKDHALIFVTDKYDHWDDLVNPVNDGHTIAATLKNRYGFETEIVENPTMEEVWEKVRSYNERRFNPQDQLLIFFAGHGHFDETFGEGYVVARNSLAVDKSRATYISHNRLRGVINNIPCEHIFLMMDVCFGGTFDPVMARSRGNDAEASPEELIVRKLSHKTRKYLTSGGKEYVSDGVAGSHSPFAAKLLEALKSNGGEDRILTIAELQASLEKLKQVPRFGSFGDDEPLSDFVFIMKR